MKMVKSLLLGSAAGLVAVAGAQAADLPVKAKAVQYVKICSLYGAGFYYIPGTDTCIKIGGFVRAEENWNANGSFGIPIGGSLLYTRATQTEYTRTRFVLSFDTRSQTEYGTLRSYGRGGWQWTTGDYQVGGSQGSSNATGSGSYTGAAVGSSSTTYFDRAFVQLAGFTFGKTESFYDFFNAGLFSSQTPYLWMDTGGSGTPVIAYTAQFGNGLSATLSLEDETEQALPIVSVGGTTTPASVVNLSNTGTSDASSNSPSNGIPDIVANLRVDQAWGSAQLEGAAHDNRAQYYSTGAAIGDPTSANFGASPGDAWGYAVGAGLLVNLPMLGKGDVVSAAANYCHGASRYCSDPNGGVRGAGGLFGERSGSTYAAGNLADAYFNSTAAGGLELPNVYNFQAGFAHHFNNQWQVGLQGGYINYNANSSAVDSIYCANVGAGVAPGAGAIETNTGAAGLGAGCRNWSAWEAGIRVLWNPVENLDVIAEVIYDRVNSSMNGAVIGTSAAGVPAVLTYGDVGEWHGLMRVQRNFWP